MSLHLLVARRSIPSITKISLLLKSSVRFQSTINEKTQTEEPTKTSLQPPKRFRKRTINLFTPIEQVKPSQLVGNGFGDKTYFIRRTSNNKIPVYHDIKSGADLTEIRRVEGDVRVLKKDLLKALPYIREDKIKIRQESKRIIIAGNHIKVIRDLLATKF